MTDPAENVVPIRVQGPSTVELTKAIEKALDENRASWAEARIKRTFVGPVWKFVRVLKSIKEFMALTATEAASLVEKHVPTVWQDLPSETSLGEPVDDPVGYFLDDWETVQVPEGGKSELRRRIEAAAARALEDQPEPDRYGPRFAHPRLGGLRTFLRTIEFLQLDYGSEPVPIPQEIFGEVLGCHQTQVSKWLKPAEREKLIVLEAKHNRGKHRSAEYRFVPYLIRKSGE